MPWSPVDPPLMNASGVFSYASRFKKLEGYDAAFGAWVTKSYGLDSRDGNDNTVVCETPDDKLLNSVGLSNPGVYWWESLTDPEDPLAELQKVELARPVYVSAFGSNPGEYALVVAMIEERVPKAAGYELNFGCPNMVPGKGEQKSVAGLIGDSPQRVGDAIRGVRRITDKPIISKLTPMASDIEGIVEAAIDAGTDAVCCANTMRAISLNGIYRPALAGITGGMSGPSIKEANQAVAFLAYRVIMKKKADVSVIGCGGIETADDVLEYRAVGADAVQMGTAFKGKGMRTKRQAEYSREVVRRVKLKLDELGTTWEEMKGVAHCGGLMKKR